MSSSSSVGMIDLLIAQPLTQAKDAQPVEASQDAQTIGAAFPLMLALMMQGSATQRPALDLVIGGGSVGNDAATAHVIAPDAPLLSANALIDAATRLGLSDDQIAVESLSVSFDPAQLASLAPTTYRSTRGADVFTPARASNLPDSLPSCVTPSAIPTLDVDSQIAVEASPLPSAPTSVGTAAKKLERANHTDGHPAAAPRLSGSIVHAADAAEVRRNPALLEPEFRAKLERVVERMRDELGHSVELRETYRSQARQDVPHEQIAREEGLRTLGPRDPGHIGLVTTVIPRSEATTNLLVRPSGGDSRFLASPGMAGAESSESNANTSNDRDRERAPQNEHVVRAEHSPSPIPAGTPAPAPRVSTPGSIAAPAELHAPHSTESVARLLDLRDTALARPMSHVVLRLDNQSSGLEDRIRVDVRGSTVGATLHIGDRTGAEQVSARVSELREALGRHGLETESIRVQAGAASVAAAESTPAIRATVNDRDVVRASTLGLASLATNTGSSTNNKDSNRDTRDQAHDHPGRQQSGEHSRQRSRRDQHGERSK